MNKDLHSNQRVVLAGNLRGEQALPLIMPPISCDEAVEMWNKFQGGMLAREEALALAAHLGVAQAVHTDMCLDSSLREGMHREMMTFVWGSDTSG